MHGNIIEFRLGFGMDFDPTKLQVAERIYTAVMSGARSNTSGRLNIAGN